MATKLELAESLTIAQLRELAADQNVDLAGLSAKDDIADAVAAGVAKDDLQAYVDRAGGDAVAENENENDAPSGDDQPVREGQPVERINPLDTAAQAEAGQSPADLELRLGGAVSGDEIIVKANPETPTAQQVEDSQQAVPGPPNLSVTVSDGQGSEIDSAVTPSDAAQIQQRVVASKQDHPAFTSAGHYSNPNLGDASIEERIANEEAYAERTGGDASGARERIEADEEQRKLTEAMTSAVRG